MEQCVALFEFAWRHIWVLLPLWLKFCIFRLPSSKTVWTSSRKRPQRLRFTWAKPRRPLRPRTASSLASKVNTNDGTARSKTWRKTSKRFRTSPCWRPPSSRTFRRRRRTFGVVRWTSGSQCSASNSLKWRGSLAAREKCCNGDQVFHILKFVVKLFSF